MTILHSFQIGILIAAVCMLGLALTDTAADVMKVCELNHSHATCVEAIR